MTQRQKLFIVLHCVRYKHNETKEEERERLAAWEKYLEGEEEEAADKTPQPMQT